MQNIHVSYTQCSAAGEQIGPLCGVGQGKRQVDGLMWIPAELCCVSASHDVTAEKVPSDTSSERGK